MTPELGILNRRGVEPCGHLYGAARWYRNSDDTLYHYCVACDTVLELDSVATSLPASPALANQEDPEELRALGQRE